MVVGTSLERQTSNVERPRLVIEGRLVEWISPLVASVATETIAADDDC